MKRWFLAGGTAAVVLMLATFNPNMPVVNNNTDIPNNDNKTDMYSGLDQHDHDHSDHDDQTAHSSTDSPTGNPHFDQLSPEMKQALKNRLLLEGPMETIQRPDGSISLPSNGRFTQMPVAVQMPDGSIQIREYSQLPKSHK